jgi:hypothetical protein
MGYARPRPLSSFFPSLYQYFFPGASAAAPHFPLANNHFLISKKEIDGRSQTSVRLLEREERIEEAARILGGINVTDAQRAAARDMLDNIDE